MPAQGVRGTKKMMMSSPKGDVANLAVEQAPAAPLTPLLRDQIATAVETHL